MSVTSLYDKWDSYKGYDIKHGVKESKVYFNGELSFICNVGEDCKLYIDTKIICETKEIL